MKKTRFSQETRENFDLGGIPKKCGSGIIHFAKKVFPYNAPCHSFLFEEFYVVPFSPTYHFWLSFFVLSLTDQPLRHFSLHMTRSQEFGFPAARSAVLRYFGGRRSP